MLQEDIYNQNSGIMTPTPFTLQTVYFKNVDFYNSFLTTISKPKTSGNVHKMDMPYYWILQTIRKF